MSSSVGRGHVDRRYRGHEFSSGSTRRVGSHDGHNSKISGKRSHTGQSSSSACGMHDGQMKIPRRDRPTTYHQRNQQNESDWSAGSRRHESGGVVGSHGSSSVGSTLRQKQYKGHCSTTLQGEEKQQPVRSSSWGSSPFVSAAGKKDSKDAKNSNSSSSSPFRSRGGSTTHSFANATTSATSQKKHAEDEEKSEKTPEQLEWEKKIYRQIKNFEQYRAVEELPPEALFPDNENWKGRKQRAAEVAIKECIQFMKDNCVSSDDDDFDDDDDMFVDEIYGSSKWQISREDVEFFFSKLPECVVFDMGFRVLDLVPNESKCCWCPCGRHLEPWQQEFHLTSIVGKGSKNFCETAKKMSPIGLMGHIRTKAEKCAIHHGIKHYIMDLYGDLQGTYGGKPIGHKALYNINDEMYKLAEAKEKADNRRMREEEKRKRILAEKELAEIKEKDKQHKERMSLLKKTNEDLQKRVQKMEDDMKALQIDKDDERDKPVSDYMLEKYCMSYETVLKTLLFGLQDKPKQKISIHVEQNFRLQNVFDRMYNLSKRGGSGMKRFPLFMAPSKNERFVYDWKIVFEVFNPDDTARLMKADRAIDEGGPTREFFSQVWTQMGELAVKYKSPFSGQGQEAIPLFESVSAGYVACTDTILKDKVRTAVNDDSPEGQEKEEELLNQIKAYYSALGKIALRAVISQTRISSTALPNLFRNVLFRRCEPKHEGQYSKLDMLAQLEEIGFNLRVRDYLISDAMSCDNDDDEEKFTDRTFFTKFVQGQFVDGRSIFITSFREGFTFDDKIDLTHLFSTMPLYAVSRILFANPEITADDVIRILKPRYSASTDDRMYGLVKRQEDFFTQVINRVLRKMDEERLNSFVYFCTGDRYLPYLDGKCKFKIVVEFSLDKMERDSLPVSHTCDNTLKLPAWVYDLDEDVFEEKLTTSILSSDGAFTMN